MKYMKPQILPILKPLFELVKGDMTRIVLLKNNTIVLLRENENYLDKLHTFGSSYSEQIMSLTLHFFRSYETIICLNPPIEDVGVLYITDKSDINKIDNKKLAFDNFLKDLEEPEIVFDSSNENIDNFEPIMYLFVNNSLKMGKGKIAAQVGHVVGILVEELLNEKEIDQTFIDWKETSMKKIVLKADNDTVLTNLMKGKLEVASLSGGNCVQIRDAGCTQIPANSLTVVGFRPMYKKDVPKEFSKFGLL